MLLAGATSPAATAPSCGGENSQNGLNRVDLVLQRVGNRAHEKAGDILVDIRVLASKRGNGHGYAGLDGTQPIHYLPQAGAGAAGL